MNVTQARLRTLARKYGLTEEDFGTLLVMCDYKCPLCLRPFTMRSRPPVVDHEHTAAMWTRGLLCSPCNWLLGSRKDDPAYYQRVADYLRLPPAWLLPGPRRRPRDAPPLH